MQRLGLPLSTGALSMAHANNTLLISVCDGIWMERAEEEGDRI